MLDILFPYTLYRSVPNVILYLMKTLCFHFRNLVILLLRDNGGPSRSILLSGASESFVTSRLLLIYSHRLSK